ncbi:hypothetical protein [Arthrobacter methylotrophus]|uniref:hypothetical protein n=1 Tax=Arthrobacter methylotrophus TaxID=121291 RepID=UPI0031EC618F
MTMDFSLMMACAVINIVNNDSRSALPDAPVVPERRVGCGRLPRLRGWLATALHRAAWLIEPMPQPATETCG